MTDSNEVQGTVTFYMKHLIPGGDGAYYVLKCVKNTQEGADELRNVLLADADWGTADVEEYDNALSGYSAVGAILNGEEWAPVKDDAPDEAETPQESEDPAAE